MTTLTTVGAKEREHREAVSALIARCTVREIHQNMEGIETKYRELRDALLLALRHMKQINYEYGMDEGDAIEAVRTALGITRAEERVCLEELLTW